MKEKPRKAPERVDWNKCICEKVFPGGTPAPVGDERWGVTVEVVRPHPNCPEKGKQGHP